jgi:hypothetical protein
MIVTMHLKSAIVQGMNGLGRASKEFQKLQEIATDFGVQIEAMHPGSRDPDLASTFYVNVPDSGVAERIRERIETTGVVESVYVKPPEGPPFL